MYEVLGLKDFGTWLRKGKTCYCNDTLTINLLKRGYLKVLKFHVTKVGRWDMKQAYERLKEQRKALDMKIKGHEEYFKARGKEETK